jgi:hypothetical protein
VANGRFGPLGAVLVCAAALALAATPAGAAQRLIGTGYFGSHAPKPPPGQILLATLSTLPSSVTGGDVLVAVRGLRPGDRLRVTRNGADVSGAFGARRGDRRIGVVRGLRPGGNLISAIVRRRSGERKRVALGVRSHPITGPVISGPHQRPFYCETDEAGLGPPIDRNCSIRTRVQWFYRADDGSYHELADPYAPYPPDTMQTTTSDGRTVPFVVRVESATINRGIARLAVLDDPRARGRGKRFDARNWNHRITYAFGESCGVGYRQGVNTPDHVLGPPPSDVGADNAFASVYGLADRLARGDLVAHNTHTTFGVNCNPLLSGETLMMMKEHVIEDYGPVARTVGVGGSGGALQQYSAANSAPGLLDAAIPIASFADIPSTAMTVVDCGLMVRYFDSTDVQWSEEEKAAVAGHVSSQICVDWNDLFVSNLDPTEGCNGEVPDEVRWRPDNPDGVRCTLQDSLVNLLGRNPRTGYARRPYDNVGVQYGLRALNAGQISVGQFIDINRRIGGFSINGRRVPRRSAMSAGLARLVYRSGGVIGRGALNQTPIIDLATYLDRVPVADIHDVVRPFTVRARLRKHYGTEASQAIWRGVSLPSDAHPAIADWLAGIARHQREPRAAAVWKGKPRSASDRCTVAAGAALGPDALTLPLGFIVPLLPGAFPSVPVGASIPERQDVGFSVCQTIAPAMSEPRIVAGGPLSDDVLKCRLRPVRRGDYAAPVSGAELAQIRRIFRTGVCDWSRPGVGEVRRSMVWPSIGGTNLHPPRPLRWVAARTTG